MFATQIAALEEPPQVHFMVEKFEVTGDNPLSVEITQSTLNDYLGDHYGLEGLQSAAEELEKKLREHGHTFHRVVLVPQELKEGIIRFEVTEFKINKISVEGNKHYDEANILSNVPMLKTGTTPNANTISRAIELANSKPSKNLKLQFFESETGGAIDAKIKVEDQSPDFFFVTLNNTGSDETGEFRLAGGYSHSNLFNADHGMTFSYTFSPDESGAVSQYGLSYDIPFYASGSTLNILLSKSDVDSGLVANIFNVSGAGTVVGVSYKKVFMKYGSYKHNIAVSLFNKQFDNNVNFFGFAQPGSGAVTTQPITISYTGSRLSASNNIYFTIGFSSNISGGSKNEDIDYDAIRTGATADWSKTNYGFGYTQFILKEWFMQLSVSGQEASDLLMSGEQFGIGGTNSVRGYDNRSILGDNGYQASLELWMPTFSRYNIRPLIFYDAGHVERNNPDIGVDPEDDPASYGAGLRWSYAETTSVVLDVGVTTKDIGTAGNLIEKGETKGHLDVFYRF